MLKFHKTDNPEDAKTAMLEVSPLWNSEKFGRNKQRTNDNCF